MTTLDTRQRLRRWLGWLVPPAAIVTAFLTVRSQLPPLPAIWEVITSANTGWIVVALVAEWVSLAMFARQQMWLLKGVGVNVSLGSALAVTYSRSAIAISMPAGSALSAGFAFQRFRKWGATAEAAAAVMVLSGLYSFGALALLWLGGFLVTYANAPGGAWNASPTGTITAFAALITLAIIITWRVLRNGNPPRLVAAAPEGPLHAASGDVAPPASSPPRHVASQASLAPGDVARPAAPTAQPFLSGRKEIATGARKLLATAGGAVAVAGEMPARRRLGALGFGMVNWLADIVCLVAITRAVHLPLPFMAVGSIYVIVQIVRQIPLTPGGMGVIEASLLGGLTAAGASQAPAAGAVLGYRLLSCWLIIPIGLSIWAWLRRTPAPGI